MSSSQQSLRSKPLRGGAGVQHVERSESCYRPRTLCSECEVADTSWRAYHTSAALPAASEFSASRCLGDLTCSSWGESAARPHDPRTRPIPGHLGAASYYPVIMDIRDSMLCRSAAPTTYLDMSPGACHREGLA